MVSKHSLKFYFKRIKNASFAELLFRVRETRLIAHLRHRFDGGIFRLQNPLLDPAIKTLCLPDFQYYVDKHILKSILEGEAFPLNGDRSEIKRFETESRGVFCADVQCSKAEFDIRMAWEPARLQHFTILLWHAEIHRGQATAEQSLAVATKGILSWIDENPFLSGPHYQSAMECGLRIPVFFYALKILDNLKSEEKNRILEAMYQHAWWVSRRLSRYSSLGNHTICEGIGLIFAGGIFRSVPDGRTWLECGIELLRQELHHQILDDGGPAEQSFSYGRFVLDLYWLAINFLEKNRLYDCQDFRPRLTLGEDFLKTFQDPQGRLPNIGDSDDGYAVAPGIYPERNLTPDPEDCEKGLRIFPSAGYTVIRDESGLIFTFDHGPLGMPPLYNHGHADALSITLAVGGRPMLVDPGTYRYNGAPEWRKYFKGTRAHNTVMVDGEDQAVQETGFIWSGPFKAQAQVFQTTNGRFLKSYHDGYKRLKNPIVHHRKIIFFENSTFLISDTFEGAGNHDFELNYHIHPSAAIRSENGWWHVIHNSEAIFIKLLAGGDFTLIFGQENPPLGWFSPAYGIKLKSWILSCRQRGEAANTTFLTAICMSSPASPEELQKKAWAICKRG